MIHNLKPGDRCGVIMPEGVQFGSTGARKPSATTPQISTSAPSSMTWSGGMRKNSVGRVAIREKNT
jgi:hypothetical protein